MDAEARTVELVVPAGLDMETADVVAPAVAQPFEHVGASGWVATLSISLQEESCILLLVLT